MRKAIIAAIVATALFAVGAFAANFTVQSDDIASGSDTVGRCSTNAYVEYSTSGEYDETSSDFVVDGATVTFDTTNTCDGSDVDIAFGLAANVGDSSPSSWVDGTCAQEVGEAVVTFTCTPDATVPVGTFVSVAVLADGNSIIAPDLDI